MAKKFAKTVTVYIHGNDSPLTFSGDNGSAAYNALIGHQAIIAVPDESENGEIAIVPYHAVVLAQVVNTSEDAEMVDDAACPLISDK